MTHFRPWAVADFISARRRDLAAGRICRPLGWSRDATVIAIGLVTRALFAFHGHGWLIAVQQSLRV